MSMISNKSRMFKLKSPISPLFWTGRCTNWIHLNAGKSLVALGQKRASATVESRI